MISDDKITDIADTLRSVGYQDEAALVLRLRDERNTAAADAVFWHGLVECDMMIVQAAATAMRGVVEWHRGVIRDFERPRAAEPPAPERTE